MERWKHLAKRVTEIFEQSKSLENSPSWESDSLSDGEEIPIPLWKSNSRYLRHSSPPLDRVVSQLNPVTFLTLTLWRRVLSEKLTVPKMVKKFQAFYWNRMFVTCLQNSLPLDFVLNHLNPVTIFTLYSFKICCNIILTPTRMASKGVYSLEILR
jgi:hypothetical protein